MTEEIFWTLIGERSQTSVQKADECGYRSLQNEIIKKYLIKQGRASVINFHEMLCRVIRELYLPKIGEVFLITSYDLRASIHDSKYISTDGFVDFRAWIVSLGKDQYGTFLNFQSEAELCEFDMNVAGTNRADLVYLSANIAKQNLGIKIDLDYHLDQDVEEFHQKINWDSLGEKYPILFKLYQQRFDTRGQDQ